MAEENQKIDHDALMHEGIKDLKDEDGQYAIAWSVNKLTEAVRDLITMVQASNQRAEMIKWGIDNVTAKLGDINTTIVNKPVAAGSLGSTVMVTDWAAALGNLVPQVGNAFQVKAANGNTIEIRRHSY